MEGAIAGSVAGVVTKELLKTLGDVVQRNFSDREKVRIGTTAFIAIEKIRTRLESGENPREDGFFHEREHDSRSDAEEIFEGALLKSKNEHEERKVKIIASIFTNTVFHSDISASEANYILHLAESMTYRQMCLLAVFERKAELEGISLATKDFSQDNEKDDTPIISDLSALQEIYQLNNLGLVAYLENDSKTVDGYSESKIMINNSYNALLSFDDVVPDKMVLTDLGKRYYSIMNLSEIPMEDLTIVAVTLSKQ